MGRRYSGDIEGKFWFGVQDSTDAEFFGGEKTEPNVVEYNFDEDDLTTIEDGITTCRKALGKYEAKLDAYFAKNDGYSDAELADKLNVPAHNLNYLIEWYARLRLGLKILACVQDKGGCFFEAELD